MIGLSFSFFIAEYLAPFCARKVKYHLDGYDDRILSLTVTEIRENSSSSNI